MSAGDYQAIHCLAEITILEATSAVGGVTVLHICGYEEAQYSPLQTILPKSLTGL